ncbi:CENP-Q, a CENPA-CAD centromere complex subunit-domain-containing protein [Hypoxylon sp. NC1633]|nr:CENP-Q, a CENPA-CAD centromere complex subunit-domain-containing protein [Hypoxylon sp. NC1633]
MAPETANQKRKRGRPTNASRDEDHASEAQLQTTRQGQLAAGPEDAREADVEESSRPRKRGRPANPEPQPEPEASQPQRARRRRVQPPALQTNGDGEEKGRQDTETSTTRTRKRGSPRLSGTNDEGGEIQENGQSSTASQSALPKKRGRPPKGGDTSQDNEAEAGEADDENEENSSILRRSGRTRRPPDTSYEAAQKVAKSASDQGSNNQQPTGREKKKQPPLSKRPLKEARQEPNPEPKKKRGRPSLNNHPPADAEANREPRGQPKKGRRSSGENGTSVEKTKKSRKQAEQDNEGSAQEEEHPKRGRPRQSDEIAPRQDRHRRSSGTQERSSSPDSDASAPRYRHLTTRTRRVPRNVIESKWTSLEAPAISSVTALLQSASRPVLLRLNNAQRHTQATAALNAVSNRLRSKISRGLPFPPATTSTRREEEFEFERAVSGIQSLEAQLDPLLHGVELLRREKERAERELDREYKVLARLGSNARAEARERRDRVRKMHVLVPEKPVELRPDDHRVPEILPLYQEGGASVFADLPDEELKGLAGQIANHMESMRGNLQQIDGVVPAIERSRGLLRAALSHLDPEVLENVILG